MFLKSALASRCIPHTDRRNENLNKYFHFTEWGSNPQLVAFTITHLCP